MSARLKANFIGLCVHGPDEVKERVKVGTRIDKKTGEEKDNYQETNRVLYQYTFMCGTTPFTKTFPEKNLKVGSKYSFEREVFLQYLNFSDAVVTEIKEK